MLRDPSDILSRYDSHVSVSELDIKRLKQAQYSRENTKEKTNGLGYWFELFAHCQWLDEQTWISRQSERFSAESLEDISFTPSQEYLDQCMAEPEIQRDFGAGTQSVTIYIIVDLRIVVGLREYRMHEKGWEIDGTPMGVPIRMGPLKTNYEEDVSAHDAKFVYSYSVREYILTSDGPARYSVRVNGG
jgi:hypothetical protein